jgi:hypothetical protein
MKTPKHTVEATSIHLQHSLVLHAGMLCFDLRSHDDPAPGRGSVVQLPFELPVPPATVAAVSLRLHRPSPLARHFVAHMRALLAKPVAAAPAPAEAEALT